MGRRVQRWYYAGMSRFPHIILFALTSLFIAAPSAHAVAAGSGVAGTLDMTWGNTTGSPITSWSGNVQLTFDPSAAARQATLAAINDPALGEPSRATYLPQLQAVRATALSAAKSQNVTCLDEAGNEYGAVWNSSATGIADARIAYEVLPPKLDLISGRGNIALTPHLASDSGGWYVGDRFTLPGRYTGTDEYPCPGNASPALRLPRLLALNGSGAVPRVTTDFLNDHSRSLSWPVRRTASGWRVMINATRRETFSESIYGPQNTQSMDMTVRSNLRLVGSLRALEARCKVPVGLIARAKSSTAAVRAARRAGLNARFAGTKPAFRFSRARYGITGQIGMGYGTCQRGLYKVWRYR